MADRNRSTAEKGSRREEDVSSEARGENQGGRSQDRRTHDREIDLGFDGEDVAALFQWKMPFGRYYGRALIDLPEEYLLWFENREFPRGRLGTLLKLSLGIKRYGAELEVKAVRRALTMRSSADRNDSDSLDKASFEDSDEDSDEDSV